MPAYAAGKAPALYPSDVTALFSAEQPASGAASSAVAIPPTPLGGIRPVIFDISFAAVPAGNLLIQGALIDTDADYQTIYTSTAKQQDLYVDSSGWKFYRAKNSTSAGGGNLTVLVKG